MIWDLFKHYLLSRRAGALIRTVAWLCMAGVGIGVMSLIVVMSVMNGFNDQIKSRLLAVEPHLVVTVPGVSDVNHLVDQPIYQELKNRKDVQTEIFETQDVIVRTVDGLFGGAVAHGVEDSALEYILRETRRAVNSSQATGTTVEVAPVAKESAHLSSGEVLVGADLARSLGIFEGDKITIVSPEALLLPAGEVPHFERVLVKGLLQTNIADIDAKAIYFGRGRSLKTLKESTSRETGFELRLNDPYRYGPLEHELKSRGLKVSSWVERNSALFYALRMEKTAIGSFLGLSALIASFSIVTVLVLLMTQKRKDIGLLMGLGLSRIRTQRLFMGVGLLLSSMGIVAGVVMGVVICLVVDKNRIPILPDIYYDSTIPARMDPYLILFVIVAATFIAVFSAYFPARLHTRELPSELLRSQKLD
jgi:lipoprotein-releasing system permease protein